VDTPAAAPGVIPVPQTPEPARSLPPIASPGGADNAAPTALQPDLKNAVAKRQEDLARKEQELRVLEGELNSRLERMQILENRLSGMIKEAEGTQDAKFRHLVDMLSNMKAKQAAAVLETLDQKVSVKVLAVMRGRQAGEILTYVRPQVAAQLTEALARMQLPLQ
jgi:flagellar motility protein MotE (MotC chaperone)